MNSVGWNSSRTGDRLRVPDFEENMRQDHAAQIVSMTNKFFDSRFTNLDTTSVNDATCLITA